MAKQKTGLHKEISAIFSGVPLPNSNERENPGATATVENSAGFIPPNTAAASPKPSPKTEQRQAEETLRPKSKTGLVSETSQNKKSLLDNLRPYLDAFLAKVLKPQPGVSQSKQMAMLLMMPVLIIIVIFVFGRLLFKPSQNNGAKKTEETASIVPVVKTEIEWKIPEPYPADLRDPMSKVSTVNSTLPAEAFRIRGIVYSEDNPSAVIDTTIVYQGDMYGGARVIKINPDSVEFEQEGKTWTQKVQH